MCSSSTLRCATKVWDSRIASSHPDEQVVVTRRMLSSASSGPTRGWSACPRGRASPSSRPPTFPTAAPAARSSGRGRASRTPPSSSRPRRGARSIALTRRARVRIRAIDRAATRKRGRIRVSSHRALRFAILRAYHAGGVSDAPRRRPTRPQNTARAASRRFTTARREERRSRLGGK